MKAHLLFAERDPDVHVKGDPQVEAMTSDLELPTLFAAMAGDDDWLSERLPNIVTQLLSRADEIRYRQDAIRDCFEREAAVREMYDLATQVMHDARRNFFRSSRSPTSVLYWSLGLLEMLAASLRRLRAVADSHAASFESRAFQTMFSTLKEELSDEYLAAVERHLHKLAFRDGVLLSASLGEGNKGAKYVLLEPPQDERSWFARYFDLGLGPHTLHISDRDETGARALADLRDRGLNNVANAVAQACDHLLSFFEMLRTELGFYVGCLNLRQRLSSLQLPFCFPDPLEGDIPAFHAQDMYDPCLALRMSGEVVGNDLNADGKSLVVITGANQGGKSTFLRAIGLAYVMMQCGMFVAARSLTLSLCRNLFTHYRREEDVEMKSGKLDEELRRMSDVVDALRPHSVVLFNESFASTNEREGSEIARQIVTALLEARVRIFFVTHHYELTRMLRERNDVTFLRAQRLDDGTRTFKIIEGRPLDTSFGSDLYQQIFDGSQVRLGKSN